MEVFNTIVSVLLGVVSLVGGLVLLFGVGQIVLARLTSREGESDLLGLGILNSFAGVLILVIAMLTSWAVG